MSDFGKMAEALRRCSEHKCRCLECEFLHDGVCSLMTDAAAAIEELQAEVKRLEPKRGEYIWIQKENGGQYKGCSICHAPIPTDSMLDYLDDEDCEFCYSCGAKMEVQDATES